MERLQVQRLPCIEPAVFERRAQKSYVRRNNLDAVHRVRKLMDCSKRNLFKIKQRGVFVTVTVNHDRLASNLHAVELTKAAGIRFVHGNTNSVVCFEPAELEPAFGKNIDAVVEVSVFKRRAAYVFSAAGSKCARVVLLQE